MEHIPIDDTTIEGRECTCYDDQRPYDDDDMSTSHFCRRCQFCDHKWWGLHCPHEVRQNPCTRCGERPVRVSEGDS